MVSLMGIQVYNTKLSRFCLYNSSQSYGDGIPSHIACSGKSNPAKGIATEVSNVADQLCGTSCL